MSSIQSSLSLVLGAGLSRGLVDSHVRFASSVLSELSRSGALNCSFEEALGMFDFTSVSITSKRSVAAKAKRAKELESRPKVSKLQRTKKPSTVVPFCGKIVGDWCCAVRFNHGLHTQCTNGKVGELDYCKTCSKQADNFSQERETPEGKRPQPPYGDIRDRVKLGLDYVDPKGKRTVPFANVAKKLNIDVEKAKAAAALLGWEISPEQLVERKVTRGRPKSSAVSDTDSEASTTKSKKRGRPKKIKKQKANTQDDLIAKLVAEAGEELLGEASATEVSSVDGSESDSSTASTKSKAELKAEKKTAKLAKKEAAKAAKLAEKEAKLAEKEAAKATQLAEKEAAKATQLAEKEAAKATQLAEKEAAKAAKFAEKEAAKAAKFAEKEAAKAAKVAEKEAAKAAKVAEKEAVKVAKVAKKEAAKAAKAAEKEAKELAEAKVEAEKAAPELDTVSVESEADSSDDEEEEVTLDTIEVDGVTYLYDPDGTYAGINNLLLTEEGTPVGIYDNENDKVIVQEFDNE